MVTLIEQFISESRDLLQKVTDALVSFEKNPNDVQLLNEIFRVIHTMKGNSGLFEFPEMTKVLHAGEDLLDALRAGQLPYSPEMADVLLEATDFVVLLTDEIEQNGVIPSHRSQIAVEIASRLSKLNQIKFNSDKSSEVITKLEDSPSPETLEKTIDIYRIPEEIRVELAKRLSTNTLNWLCYTPEPECFFKGEDPFYLMQQCPDIEWFDVEYVMQTDSSVESMVVTDSVGKSDLDVSLWDPYQCCLRFIAISSASNDALDSHFRYVSEQVTFTQFPVDSLRSNESSSETKADYSKNKKQASEELNEVSLTILKTQVQILEQPIEKECFKGVLIAVVNTVTNVCKIVDQTSFEKELNESLNLALQSYDPQPVMICVADIYQKLQPKNTANLPLQTESLPSIIDVTEASKSQSRSEDSQTSKTLKVDQDKIDRLMNLIGEMVVAKNSLPYLADRAENQYGVRDLSREIKNQYSVINRIAEEMQQSIMQIRMMPVSSIFQRFPRLVRDTCRKLGKEVNLILEGEFTEADKLVIEALADPLIHIVRNSLDHGIEMPDVRLKKGKPQEGKLLIRASQLTDSVLIEIQDDGKGIDPEVIKQKAFEKGLITEAAMQKMTDQQAINLVFAAGFSTADIVSDLSGRGVGMDVVRSAIEKINGKVTIDSEVDRGTTLRLVLPLSMAITNVIVIESNKQQFGIPMDLVMETVRISQQDIRQIKQSRAALLRDRIVPLLSLNNLLGLDSPQQTNEQGEVATLVVKINNEYIGLIVDSFKATVDIILKPLPSVLSSMKWYSGSALMGDGSVLMVLNPKELLS